MTRFLLCVLLLFFLPCAVFAQSTGTLTGRVVDDLGDPLPGANVIIEGTQLGASTDVDGHYFVLGIPVGTYTMTASFVGFESQTFDEISISPGYTTEQNFELGGLDLGEIFLYCGGPNLILRDPFASRVIFGDEIERLPTER